MRADRDVVAVVPASEVAPPLTVATVDGVDPLRDPSAYAVTTEGPEPPAVTTVTVTGDVMLGRRVGDRLAQVGDPTAALRPMARRLAGADLTIGNLESTLSQAGAPRQGGDSFAASPAVRSGLELAGYDVLSLANNHTGDFGPQALVETVRRVRAGGFVPVGAGVDLARASRPAIVERNGVRFGVVAFDAIGETPAAAPEQPGCAAGADGPAHRAAGAGRPRPGDRSGALAAVAGRRRARAAALGHAVHARHGARPAAGGPRADPGRGRPSSSAGTRTGCRGWSRSATR